MVSAASLHHDNFQPKPALCSHDPDGFTGEVDGMLTQSSNNTASSGHHPELDTFANLLNGWPSPEPLGADLPAVPEFDPELLPVSLKPLVIDVADRMQVPVDFPATTVMAALSGVCGRRVVIQPKERDDSWSIVPNLWGAIIGPPGVMKSPVISAMMEPLRTIEREWRQEYETVLNEHKEEEERLKLDFAVWMEIYRRAKKANREPPERPHATDLNPPSQKRLWTTDVTFEKLHELLRDNPAGIMVLRDELSDWLAGLERQGHESDRSFFLECWNGDTSFTMDRIVRGSITVEHCCVSIFGGIQPARMRSYFADALRDGTGDDGLI